MLRNRLVTFGLLIASLIIVTQSVIPVSSQEHHGDPVLSLETRQLIAKVRGATAQFRDVDQAIKGGYGKFQNCFKNDAIGGMGQHYVNGDLLASGDNPDPLKPQALVYEPGEDGSLTLVALEYLVFKDKWDPKNTGRKPPVLFEQNFHLKTDIPETPPAWILHIWIGTHNPEGIFSDYNPLVFCPAEKKS
jgi:hypothetical protein